MNRKKNASAFTLMELIMVIVIAGIIASLSVARWSGQFINLGAQADGLLSDIRYAQNLSMTRGVRYAVTILTTTTYKIATIAGADVTNRTLGSGITFGTLTNLPNNLIAFDNHGGPCVTTAVPCTALASTATIPMTAQGQTRTVSILPTTGQAAVS